MSTLKQIKSLEKERASVIEKMLYQKLMTPGAYGQVYCRCGKKNCWCCNGKAIRTDGSHTLKRGDQELNQFQRKILSGLRKLLKIIVILKKGKRRLKNMRNA